MVQSLYKVIIVQHSAWTLEAPLASFPRASLVSPRVESNHHTESQPQDPASMKMGVERNHLAKIPWSANRDKFVAWQRSVWEAGRHGFPVWSLVPKLVSTQSHRNVFKTYPCMSYHLE